MTSKPLPTGDPKDDLITSVYTITVTNFSAVPEDKPVLEIVTESPSIPGTRKYTCLANSFFFSEGIKWAIEDHSKHLKFLEDGKTAFQST